MYHLLLYEFNIIIAIGFSVDSDVYPDMIQQMLHTVCKYDNGLLYSYIIMHMFN